MNSSQGLAEVYLKSELEKRKPQKPDKFDRFFAKFWSLDMKIGNNMENISSAYAVNEIREAIRQ